MEYKTALKTAAYATIGFLGFSHQTEAEQAKVANATSRVNTSSLIKYLKQNGELAKPKEGGILTFPEVYFKRKVEDTPTGFIVYGVCFTPSTGEVTADKEVHTRTRQRYGEKTMLTEIITSRTFVQDGGINPLSGLNYGRSEGTPDYGGVSTRTNPEEGLKIPTFRNSALTPEEKLAVYNEITGKFIGGK